MPQQQDNDRRSSGDTPPPGKVGAKGDPGQAPPPRGYWLMAEIGARIARWFGLREYRGEVSDKTVPVVIVGDISQSREAVSGADYDVIPLDLGVARAAGAGIGRVVQQKTVAAIWVDDISAGAAVSLKIGSRPLLTLKAAMQGYRLNPPETTDITVENAAQAGLTLKLAVAWGVTPA